MLNKSRLDTVLAAYKQNFVSKQWEDEKYKWEAVKWFQDNWNVNAPDFAEMLNRSLDKTFNLLASHNNFPKGMIVEFAQSAPEEVRAMFINLFDENKDLLERIDSFKMQSTIMLEKYGNGAVQHYQNENAISIYLWLRYPDKYYIYKYSEVKIVASKLEFSYVFKKGAYTDNIRNFFELYNEICAELKQDEELKNMFAAQITEKCYSDPELRTLTIDIGFFISREFNKIVSEPVYNTKLLEKYTPNLTADDWESLISDTNIFTYSSLEIMKRLIDYGGKATCTQLAVKYGESGIFYKNGSIALAKRVHNASGCSTISVDEENYKWLSVLYLIDDLKKDNEENCVLKMRDELLEAFNRVDLSSVSLFARTAPRFWKISHGNDCIAENEFNIFIKKKVVVVHKDTAAKGKSKVSQGDDFTVTMKKGDFFYLCRGNSIRLLGMIDSDDVKVNQEKKNGWCERSYTVIAESGDTSAYVGEKKWWTPNENSTCISIPENEIVLFEKNILKPYFNISKEELLKDNLSEVNYWFLNANPKMWSMASMPVGKVQSYTLYNANGNKRRIFKNFIAAKAGDMVIGYESTPVKQIVALMKISAEQDGERIYFEKVEGLSSPIDFSTIKKCPELDKMEYFTNQQGSLFKLSKGEYEFILDMIRDENPVSLGDAISTYTKTNFLDEVYMTEKRYNSLVGILKNKKNIILQGAPGVGKTFAARRLAWSMMGEKDDSRIEFVQFHQNYSYEDFMMGYKPVEDGFELKYGIFYRFCQKAANQPGKEFFFIIDEINRGNMSKIFGELLMLIEKDYRGIKATLAYNGLSFSVPENLYIIGMMNTADRSLAMIDYALRRRFSFFEVEPGFDSEGFIHYQNSLNNETLNELVNKVKDLNREISLDKSLGKGFCIGHSYFCGRDVCSEEWLHSIVDYDILPMLSEYWFDDANKLQRWENILQGVFQ